MRYPGVIVSMNISWNRLPGMRLQAEGQKGGVTADEGRRIWNHCWHVQILSITETKDSVPYSRGQRIWDKHPLYNKNPCGVESQFPMLDWKLLLLSSQFPFPTWLIVRWLPVIARIAPYFLPLELYQHNRILVKILQFMTWLAKLLACAYGIITVEGLQEVSLLALSLSGTFWEWGAMTKQLVL